MLAFNSHLYSDMSYFKVTLCDFYFKLREPFLGLWNTTYWVQGSSGEGCEIWQWVSSLQETLPLPWPGRSLLRPLAWKALVTLLWIYLLRWWMVFSPTFWEWWWHLNRGPSTLWSFVFHIWLNGLGFRFLTASLSTLLCSHTQPSCHHLINLS